MRVTEEHYKYIKLIKRSDIANAISRTDYYDFLIDIVEESYKNKLHFYANYHLMQEGDINNIFNPAYYNYEDYLNNEEDK